MIKVNLVPQEILDKEVQRQRAIQAGVVAVCVLLVFAGISFSHYRKKVILTERLEEGSKRLSKLKAIVDQVNDFERQAAAVRARLGVMGDLLKSRELYPQLMVDVMASFPSGVWIGKLNTKKEETVIKLSMPAFATSTRDLTTWLRTLEDSTLFSEAEISPIRIEKNGTHGFTMKMDYTPRFMKDKKP